MSGPGTVNVLLIGGGGREHALAWRLRKSPRLGRLFVSHPDNPGLAALGEPVDVPVSTRESYRLVQFCDKHGVGLVVIGPEEPLAEGLADKLRAPHRLVFGPGKDGAQLEADKAWSKSLMRAASIPTGEARICRTASEALEHVLGRSEEPALATLLERASRIRDGEARTRAIDAAVRVARGLASKTPVASADVNALKDLGIIESPAEDGPGLLKVAAALAKKRTDVPVIKASGLAKGKGVIVPGTMGEAVDAVRRIMIERAFGDAGAQVVIEERLTGPEVSVLALVDGRSIYVLETCQDHKRLGDNDTGPNTGGMGAFSPSGSVDAKMMARIERDILVPTLDALNREGIDYRGVIYAGLMLTPAGPKVIEYNCRFGDPECQALMVRLESDLLEALVATCEGRLHEIELKWRPGASCCVVLASDGYPDSPRTGLRIDGLEDADAIEGAVVFHAGTRRGEDGSVVTAGGRVLGVTAAGDDLDEARRVAYAACEHVRFPGRVMRRDIGALAVKRR